ncbi:MAG: hypothetical protein HC898_07970 [Phycisphaerales bacterium]|nr:hypothetical protein [Phycisphaerales bacterium]
MGPIGVACARSIASDQSMQLVGLVDIDPAKRGLALDDLDEQPDSPPTEQPGDIHVVSSIAEAVAGSPSGGADVAIVTTILQIRPGRAHVAGGHGSGFVRGQQL